MNLRKTQKVQEKAALSIISSEEELGSKQAIEVETLVEHGRKRRERILHEDDNESNKKRRIEKKCFVLPVECVNLIT